jgi:hypothetical protein
MISKRRLPPIESRNAVASRDVFGQQTFGRSAFVSSSDQAPVSYRIFFSSRIPLKMPLVLAKPKVILEVC